MSGSAATILVVSKLEVTPLTVKFPTVKFPVYVNGFAQRAPTIDPATNFVAASISLL